MMHLRVISPPDLTDGVVQQLKDDPGTANLVLHRGAAVSPAGDVTICDVVREVMTSSDTGADDIPLLTKIAAYIAAPS